MANKFRYGAIASDDITGLIFFTANCSNGNYDCLESPQGTNYQVTAGKTLKIIYMKMLGAGASTNIKFLYGDDAVDDGAGAPTNPVDLTPTLTLLVGNTWYDFNLLLSVPATKYPHITATGDSGKVIGIGIEI